MSKGGGTQKETPQQKAMAEYAMQQMADYRKRWLPVQKQLAADIQRMGAVDSSERTKTRGQGTTETEAQFGQARTGVEAALSNSGAGPGSGKFKLAVAGMGDDAATSRGLGMTASDQAVDEAYTRGIGQLMALGRGEKASAQQGMVDIAGMSSRQAASDAQMSAARAAGTGQLVGQVAGLGLSAAMGQPAGQGMYSADMTPNITPIVPGNSPYSATSADIMARR